MCQKLSADFLKRNEMRPLNFARILIMNHLHVKAQLSTNAHYNTKDGHCYIEEILSSPIDTDGTECVTRHLYDAQINETEPLAQTRMHCVGGIMVPFLMAVTVKITVVPHISSIPEWKSNRGAPVAAAAEQR
jgi:hypothetical protein